MDDGANTKPARKTRLTSQRRNGTGDAIEAIENGLIERPRSRISRPIRRTDAQLLAIYRRREVTISAHGDVVGQVFWALDDGEFSGALVQRQPIKPLHRSRPGCEDDMFDLDTIVT